MRLVVGDVLDANATFIGNDVAHLVDQQEGIAVRDDPLDQGQIGIPDLRIGVGHICSRQTAPRYRTPDP